MVEVNVRFHVAIYPDSDTPFNVTAIAAATYVSWKSDESAITVSSRFSNFYIGGEGMGALRFHR